MEGGLNVGVEAGGTVGGIIADADELTMGAGAAATGATFFGAGFTGSGDGDGFGLGGPG